MFKCFELKDSPMCLYLFSLKHLENQKTKLRLMCVNVYGPVKTEKRIMTYIDYSH